ncbi:hypothetical protein [Ralstonia insidiosa]|uniref:hypothetical protein n=1 Tax=Ralstonia insidiosa TaxID=190721 RepID=UPI000A9DDEAE|nr:hypothetical protein [Ralstonia insidiosa]
MAKKSIHKVRKAIAELQAKGAKVTSKSIGEHLDISHQRVHQILTESNELSLLPSARRKAIRPTLIEAIKKFDTAHLSLKEIQQLPIDGLADLPHFYLGQILRKNSIPHGFNIEEKLSQIDTAQYTVKELSKMTGYAITYTRTIIYNNKIPYKSGIKVDQK